MNPSQPKNPLHGITLGQLLINLVDDLSWEAGQQNPYPLLHARTEYRFEPAIFAANTLGKSKGGSTVLAAQGPLKKKSLNQIPK